VDILDALRELGRNLYWTWHPEVIEIFRDIDPTMWREVNHNPVEFLSRIDPEVLKERAADLALEARVAHAFRGLREYLETRQTWGARYAGSLRVSPVAYFSAEFGLHESLPIYSGGLGVLAGDHLKSASDLGLPVVGVGLLYAKGYFTQTLDPNGWQQEHYFVTDINMLPIEPVTDEGGRPIRVSLRTRSFEFRVGAWSAHVGRCRLVLLDTNVDGNNDEIRGLTSQLYGGDIVVRIRQELVLGVGGMRVLEAMGIQPGVIHLNEGHSAFAVLELARRLMQREGRAFYDVQERAASKTVFTTHTPVWAGHDRFEPSLVEETLGALRDQLKISEKDFLALGRKNPDDRKETFCMTVLGLKMSRHRNAVSALHARVSRSMWRDLWPGRPENEIPIGHITNGVHVGTWLAVSMARVYNTTLGDNWQKRIDDPHMWAKVQETDGAELWEQHRILKTHLVDYVRRSVCRQDEMRGEIKPDSEDSRPCLDPSILTIGFARRFAAYKRADLLLRDLDRLDRLVNHPERPVQIIYAGKAHPADTWGKELLRKIFQVTRDKRFAGRIVLIENYDINVARHLVQGVDLWLNTPYRPMEACGTSGQKIVLNGGLNMSVPDGWWAEAYDGTNGFAIGRGDEHIDWLHQDQLDTQMLYERLEDEVVPLFYDRDAEGVPRGWIARQKNAIQTLAWPFNAHRMVIDYAMGCYLSAVEGATSSFPGRMRRIE